MTCALNFTHGSWYGGTAHCHFQSLYVMFGITASIWMNAVIARQIYRMADCAARHEVYVAPTSHDVMKHVLVVYSFALVIAPGPMGQGGWPACHWKLTCGPLRSCGHFIFPVCSWCLCSWLRIISGALTGCCYDIRA
ncbi:unnamed protein product [Polarella glacialis]|uniref:Uncharacterized protein n=1 Tax=Polarella glacialis TaxID=89957 RepID=A0A813KA31_POLGL|nr:unnamed protein product [Polarella glacialis]